MCAVFNYSPWHVWLENDSEEDIYKYNVILFSLLTFINEIENIQLNLYSSSLKNNENKHVINKSFDVNCEG
jgi:hypothetical protein